MSKNAAKKRRQETRLWAERQYRRHRRHNMAFAKPGQHDFLIILDNLKPSFNIGKIFRSGDAFGTNSIHLIGTEYFEVKPAKGSFKHVPAFFHPTFQACHEQLKEKDYTFFILDPAASRGIDQVALPPKSAFVFGHEEYGISFSPAAYPAMEMVSIPQCGRVDSLNVSIAASITMYEYIRQQRLTLSLQS